MNALPSALKDNIRSIFLAGPIAMLDWRHTVVQGLRDNLWHAKCQEAFPVLKQALFARYDYVGPYWPFVKSASDWYHDNVPGGAYFHAYLRDLLSEEQYMAYCSDAIRRADLVAARFGENEDWTTIAQLIFAVSIGKKILAINRTPFQLAEDIFLNGFFLGDASLRSLSPRFSLGKQLGLTDLEIDQGAGHGFVYFIEAIANRHIKIGWAKNPKQRLKKFQTGSPTKYKLLGTIPGSRSLERKVHKDFGEYRVQGEWFFGMTPIREFIKSTIVSPEEWHD